MAPGGSHISDIVAGLHQENNHATHDRRDAGPSPPSLPQCWQDQTCKFVPTDHIHLPRTTFIATITLLTLLTLLSTCTLLVLLHHRRARRIQSEEAKTWGRKSRYLDRLSIARKQLDDDFRRQYHGVYVSEVVENPEMGSDSPVEMGWEERVWEVPNVEVGKGKRLPDLPKAVEVPESVRVREGLGVQVQGGGGRAMGVGRKSLFFCDGVGVWLPKR